MTKEIRVERQDVDGADFTLVTQEGSEVLRACVVVPFDPADILSGQLPRETPHLLEHVVCRGDARQTGDEFKEQAERLGGFSNAFTYMTIKGLQTFETTQPDTGTRQVRRMVESVFNPALRTSDIEDQRVVVGNELDGYLQDPSMQRMNAMAFRQGTRYTTDPLSIQGLPDITPDHLRYFHRSVFSRANARVVLTGRPDVVEPMVQPLSGLVGNGAEGVKVYAANPDMIRLPDYHDHAPEIPRGMTDFLHCRVFDGDVTQGIELPEFVVAANAFYEFIVGGNSGIVQQSRNRGLSYGLQAWWQYNRRQISLSVGDTTSIDHVEPQINLLTECLSRVALYSGEDFERFKQKQIGRYKINSVDLLGIASFVEQLVSCEEAPELVTPQQYRQALQQTDPSLVVARVRDLAERLREPSFIRQHAFGTNPFAT